MIELRCQDRAGEVPSVLVVLADGTGAGPDLSTDALPVDAADEVASLLASLPATDTPDVHTLPRPGRLPSCVLVVRGVGSPTSARSAGARLARDLPSDALLSVEGRPAEVVRALAEGLSLASYRFRAASPADRAPVVTVVGTTDDVLEQGRRAARSVALARDLANTRSNVKTPDWLGGQAHDQLGPLGVRVDVRDDGWLREHGFGGVLAVGGGSQSPPRLIEARWPGVRGRNAAGHLVLVGKGITFDTGGLNIKRGEAMRPMYTDMAGGAAVLGAVALIAASRLPVRVTALVPAAENAVSGSSYRPSDVVRQYGGRTSEILNTDAEGRIVLADALAYAVDRLRPTALVDVATLTGAMKVTLGLRTAGLIASDDALADLLLGAAAEVDEPLWRLPLARAYDHTLSSSVADANNAPGNPGAITAGLFLRPFAGTVPWAHLDIAGPARATEAEGIVTPGATGFGVRLLARLAERLTA